MRQKMFLMLILAVAIIVLLAAVLVNYFYLGTIAPEKIVGSVI
jgi:hypothetical protein